MFVHRLKATPSLDRIMPALIHIQAHLDQDLSLDLLADEARLSKHHFHKLFHKVTGETPKSYVDRLRLERAALHLRIRRATVLEIALECGYQNHETFTRAFRTHFAMTPRDFRRQWPHLRTDLAQERVQRPPHEQHQGKLSTTRIVNLARMIVAFIRHLGPYEQVTRDNFQRLTTWARKRGIVGATPLLGIAHDAPGITPVDKLHFDCCVQVPEAFAADGEIACQRTPGGEHAITDYVGSWDLQAAYATIFERLRVNGKIEIIGLPAIEIFQTTRIGEQHGLAHVTIAIPVKSRTEEPPRERALP
jgi:AraC family transcriptional regulator